MNFHKINLFIIFLLTLTFYAYFIKPLDGNVSSRLGLVKAIVEEHSVVIDSYQDGELETIDKAFVNGHYYTDKAIGASLLGTLVYLPIYRSLGQPLPTELFVMLVTALGISIPCALLAPLFYSLALRVVKDKWFALTIALCISLGTPVFPYAGAFYGHSLAALLAFSIFFLWIEVNQLNAPITPNRCFLSGLLLGFMVLTEYTTLIIAILLLVYILIVIRSKQTAWDWKSIALLFTGSMFPLLVFLYYNWLCFGSPLEVGYANEKWQGFREAHSEGLMGIGWPNLKTLLYLSINPMQGIFLQSPVLLAATGSAVLMRRERTWRLEFWIVTSIILVYFLAISGLKIWWGGAAFTVRHLIPILPLFGIYLLFLPRRYLLPFIGIGLLSFFQMLIASATTWHPLNRYIEEVLAQGFSFSWESSLLYQRVLPQLLHNRLSFTWGQYFFGLESWYFNLVLPLLIAIGLLLLFYLIDKQEERISTSPA